MVGFRHTYDLEEGIGGRRPWWVSLIPFLRNLWSNPVFVRNYGRSRVKRPVSPIPAFLVGAFLSAPISVGIAAALGTEWESVLTVCGVWLLAVPIILLYVVILIWMFIACLVTTPRELQSDIGLEQLNPMLSTPITDADLYFGETMPNVVRGLEISESFVALSFGLFLPAFAICGVPCAVQALGIPQGVLVSMLVFIAFPLVMVYMIVNLVLMMLLLSFAAGIYSVSMAMFGAIVATLVHYFVVKTVASMISSAVRLVFTLPALAIGSPYSPYMYGGEFVFPVVGVLAGEVLKIVLVGLGCYLTALYGVSAFAHARRQGYYMPYVPHRGGV